MKFVLFVLAVIGSSLAVPFAQNEELPIAIPEGLTFRDFFPGNESATDSERIVGGAPAPIERFPWQLSLRRNNVFRCGGVIISATRGLTAAHCVRSIPANTFTVVVGTTKRLDERSFRTPISRHVVHPNWKPRIMRYEVAVLWFVNPLPLGSTIRPIALPAQNAAVPYGVDGVVSGWGETRNALDLSPVLMFTVIRAITNQQCNQVYGGLIHDDMVCAAGGGRGTCRGDNGGGLVVNGVLTGVVVFGRSCRRPDIPVVFARVSYVVDWIRSVV